MPIFLQRTEVLMNELNERGYCVVKNHDGTYTANYRGELKTFSGRKAKGDAYAWAKRCWHTSFIRTENDPADSTIAILAEEWGISQQRVSQMERNAIGKVREALLSDPMLLGLLRDLQIRTEDLGCFEVCS